MEHFNFSHTLLTKEQSTNLLKGIAKSKIMRTLRIADIKFGLMTLEGNKFGECISKNTEVVDLSNTQISEAALESLMTKIMQFQCMKSLCLSNINLGIFKSNSRMLTSSLASIPQIKLSGCFADQQELVETILEEIKIRKKVTKLDISLNNMSSINENLLIETFSSMKKLDLSQTSLTKDQTSALLSSITQSSELKTLKLNDNDLSHIEIPILTNLVVNLKVLDLMNTNLVPLQIMELITKGEYYQWY